MGRAEKAIMIPTMAPPRPAKRATYQDVLDAPEKLKTELIDGVLYQVAPRPRHQAATGRLLTQLSNEHGDSLPSSRRRWVFLHDTELHFGEDVLVPDISGWLIERFPGLGEETYYVTAPDLVIETLSPSTQRVDRVIKLAVFLRERIPNLWYVDPVERTVECLQLDGPGYRLLRTFGDDGVLDVPPFADGPIDLSRIWL